MAKKQELIKKSNNSSIESKTKKPVKKEKTVKSILEAFLENIKSVEIFFNRLSPIAEIEDLAIEKEKKEYLINCLKDIFGEGYLPAEKEEEKKKFELSKADLNKLVYKVMKAPNIPAKNYTTLARGSFIMLNNYFEYLFSDLLTYHFKKNTSTIEAKRINISLDELKKYSSIDEAYDDFLYKEVEQLLLDMNFEELKSYFTVKLNIGLEEELIKWDFINEIRERRHIIVHNNSIVNKKYIHRSQNPFTLKLDDEVTITTEYFKKSMEEIKLAGTLLALNCWGSWDKNNTTGAIWHIMTQSYNELKTNNYEFSIKLGTYTEKSIKPRNDDEDDYCYRIKFNHCIALKKLGQQEDLDKKIAKIKIGALSPVFKMAQLTLKNSYEEVIELIPKAVVADEFTLEKYLDWPLFDEMRGMQEIHQKALAKFQN